jgi:hypothetical protein
MIAAGLPHKISLPRLFPIRAEETVKTFWNQLQLTRSGAASTLRFNVGFKSLRDSFSFNPRTPTNQNKSGLFQALLTDEIRLSNSTLITPACNTSIKKLPPMTGATM